MLSFKAFLIEENKKSEKDENIEDFQQNEIIKQEEKEKTND